MTAVWIVLGVIVLVAIAGVISYNRFVTQKNLIKDAWANIDTELRRRYDLIPNLVETVKGYATHEREVFEEVTRARASAAGATGSPAAQAAAEGPFMAALGKLFAVAEAYPDLKANQNFLALQTELSNTEDRLQTARRFYNANVRTYNTRLRGRSRPRSSPACSTSSPRSSSRSRTRSATRDAPQVDFATPPSDPAPPAPPAAPSAPDTPPAPPASAITPTVSQRAPSTPGSSYASGGGPPQPSIIVARRTSVVSHIHTTDQTTATPPMTTAVCSGRYVSASQPGQHA